MTDEQQIDFTLVRERLEFIEFKQNLGDNNMRAMTVAGLVVLGASENTLPASLEFGKLQKETRLAIATIIGEIDVMPSVTFVALPKLYSSVVASKEPSPFQSIQAFVLTV